MVRRFFSPKSSVADTAHPPCGQADERGLSMSFRPSRLSRRIGHGGHTPSDPRIELNHHSFRDRMGFKATTGVVDAYPGRTNDRVLS
ncbi:hypothetical protein GMOD_00008762 [Pyrenophora seminiperda CCB06]|uniref:Uncharacterized protein n=1 Tax=Pyrenophora seminiperda CCB06 TaxID=1302712 RepID=A0A3M7M5V6_9PLEO|nr:hypothetical protein GMOD_00008762 [Pyrenophora seminiperda CCB06]